MHGETPGSWPGHCLLQARVDVRILISGEKIGASPSSSRFWVQARVPLMQETEQNEFVVFLGERKQG